MLGTLRDGKAPETHQVQYFEMMGNRGIYFQGWTAVTKHRTPWKADTPPPFDDRRLGAVRPGRLDAGARSGRREPGETG